MRYGAGLDVSKPIPEIIERAKGLKEAGFGSVSASHIFGYDALTLLALVGAAVPDIEVQTAVVPIYTRHPVAMAQQALTIQAATGGRLALGIGLSHQLVIEHMYGLSFEQPLRAMREYLAVLMPLVRRERAQFEGETLKVAMGPLEVDAPAPPVIVAALGTRMLELAGEVADGTSTWMTGPKTLADHIIPTIRSAAEGAGRPSPRIVCALPVCLTDDVEAARARANELFAIYGQLPSYRAMLDREGAATPGDVAIAGSEDEVRAVLAGLDESGVTDFAAAPFGSSEEVGRTMALLSGLAGAAR